MKSNLSDICDYVKGKVDVNLLNNKTYISTENMIPYKGGITLASSLPNISLTQSFKKDDVLISNIRPYFKKIWRASFDGGCSNDVLVFRAKDGTNPIYLYYLLSSDSFFDFVTSTSKGTKMPRGDKSAIMSFGIPDFPFEVQTKISEILINIDKKIELNNSINQNLLEQIHALCNAWLVDYIPFNSTCPNDWKFTSLCEIADFISGYSYKGADLQQSNIAMATIKNFDRNGGFKLDGYKEIAPSKKVKSEQYATLFDTLVAHTDLTQNAEVIGNAEPILSLAGYKGIIFSMDVVKVIPKSDELSKFMIAALLQTRQFKSHCLGYVNGTTVLHLSKKALPEYGLFLPSDFSILKPLDHALSSMYKMIANNIEENRELTLTRDYLLPKLMSGEIDVSSLDI